MASSKTWKDYEHKSTGARVKARKLDDSCSCGGEDFDKGDYILKFAEGAHLGLDAKAFKASYKAKGK
jgi:hypothetical protein